MRFVRIFSPGEKVEIYYYYKPKIEEQNPVGRPSNEIKENFLNYSGQTRDVIGGVVGVSGKTLEKIVKVYEAAIL
jgi:hypothetical protein